MQRRPNRRMHPEKALVMTCVSWCVNMQASSWCKSVPQVQAKRNRRLAHITLSLCVCTGLTPRNVTTVGFALRLCAPGSGLESCIQVML